MNLTVPYSWLKEYVRLSVSPKEISSRMSLAGCTIDRVHEVEGETIFDVEITTNRPDAFSLLGFAREVATVFGKKFQDLPSEKDVASAYTALLREASSNQRKDRRRPYSLSIEIQNSAICKRYCGAVLDHIQVRPSPPWMQKRLQQAGMRPINNVVDITNYCMLEIGQPMHAFDADQLVGLNKKGQVDLFAKKIIVRNAKKGETINTLDGEVKKLTDAMLVIADESGPLAIAGIKGGGRAGIHSGTNTVVLESANFEPVSIRTTSRVLDLRTDSSARYEKGLSPEYASRSLLRAIELLKKYADAVVISKVVDAYPKKEKKSSILFNPNEITRVVGISIPLVQVKKILLSLGFQLKQKGKNLTVEPPFWRRGDCEASHDLVEEVARIYGYAKVPSRLLSNEIPHIESDPILTWERKTKEALRSCGFVEVMNYSCIGEQLLEKMATPLSGTVALYNPLSAEFAYLRPSLLGGLLETAESNEQRVACLRVFELSKVYAPTQPKKLPSESRRLAGVLMRRADPLSLLREAKGVVEVLLGEWFGKTQKNIAFHRLDRDDSFWQKGKAALIIRDGKQVGICGLPLPERMNIFGIKTSLAAFDLDFEALGNSFEDTPVFTPLPKYPTIVRDIACVVSNASLYEEIKEDIKEVDPLVKNVEAFDVFEGAKVGAGKRSLAIHITYQSSDRTLHAEEVDAVHAKVLERLQKKFDAHIR